MCSWQPTQHPSRLLPGHYRPVPAREHLSTPQCTICVMYTLQWQTLTPIHMYLRYRLYNKSTASALPLRSPKWPPTPHLQRHHRSSNLLLPRRSPTGSLLALLVQEGMSRGAICWWVQPGEDEVQLRPGGLGGLGSHAVGHLQLPCCHTAEHLHPRAPEKTSSFACLNHADT